MSKEKIKKFGKKPIGYGKTKNIWPVVQRPDVVIMESFNEITADNDATKTKSMSKKAICSTTTTSRMFELLHQAGIPTAYVEQLSDTEILAKNCTMIPLEVIIRRFATGSYLERMPNLTPTGNPNRFHKLVFEVFLKTKGGKLGDLDLRNYLPKDKEKLIKYLNVVKSLKEIQKNQVEKKEPVIQNLAELEYEVLLEEAIKIIDDPWIENPKDISKWTLRHPKKPTWEITPLTTMDGSAIITAAQLEKIEEMTRKIFLVLEGAWNTLGYRLIDFKIEFGIDYAGNLIVADVIDNDSWRLRTDDWKELSKQTFRDNHPLAQVQENYMRVAELVNQFRIPKQPIILWRGSPDDKLECFADEKFLAEIPAGIVIENVVASGHKAPVKVAEQLNELHTKYPEGGVIIAIVGMSNGLGPILSARTTWPVLSYCNSVEAHPEDVWSSLRTPSAVPNSLYLNIKNAYLQALNIFSMKNPAAYMVRQFAIEKFDK